MKKYILLLLLGLVYIGVFGQTKEEENAFEKIETFLKDKGNYNLTISKVNVSKGFDLKKDIYFYMDNNINLTNQKQRCIKRDSTNKCIQFADNIVIPINKKLLVDYPNKLKEVKYNNSALFKAEKLDELSITLNNIFKTKPGTIEPTIDELKVEINTLTTVNTDLTTNNNKLKKDNEQLKKGLLYPLIGVSALVLVLLFLLLHVKQKSTKDLKVQDNNESKENEDKKQIEDLTKQLSNAESEKTRLQSSIDALMQELTTAKTTIANLEAKYGSKSEQNNKKKPTESPEQKQDSFVFSKTFYAQSPGDKYFTKIKYKFHRGNTPYVLRVNEEETEGEFYLYQSEDNYEDALMRHDSVLLYACEIPKNGIDKKRYSKVETPENGKGKIKKVGDKWEIVQKAQIKLS